MSNRDKSYKNNQEYIKLQDEITHLNAKLKELYDKKKKIKLYNDKVSKINKIYLIIAVSFEILAIILTKGLLLIIQSFVVAGVSFIGFDTSKKVYEEERKIKINNKNIDTEIESTEAELKIAKGNLDSYVKRQQKQNKEELEKDNSKELGRNIINNISPRITPSFEEEAENKENKEKDIYARIKSLGRSDDNN